MNAGRPWSWLTLGLALALVSACGGRPGLPEPSQDLAAAPGANINDYKLDSGDQVRVIVFGQEDLSGEFLLDGLGNISLPLIGEVQAKGLNERGLEMQIKRQLSDGFLVDPQVAVEILTYRPFFVLGEVNRPGSYDYLPNISIAQAVAVAGGYTYRASLSGITLQRGGCRGQEFSVAEDTGVLPGDCIRVPERWF